MGRALAFLAILLLVPFAVGFFAAKGWIDSLAIFAVFLIGTLVGLIPPMLASKPRTSSMALIKAMTLKEYRALQGSTRYPRLSVVVAIIAAIIAVLAILSRIFIA